jgi:hypothetical protein
MTDAQIQARAVIASALIQTGKVEVNNVHQLRDPFAETSPLPHLRAMVDAILDALINPKFKPKPKR